MSAAEEHALAINLSSDISMSKFTPIGFEASHGNLHSFGASAHNSVHQPPQKGVPPGLAAEASYYYHPAGGVAAHNKLGGKKLVATRGMQHARRAHLAHRTSSEPEIILPFDDLA
jgi:hypothetical protein